PNDKFKNEFPEVGCEGKSFNKTAEGFDIKKNRQLCRIKNIPYIITSVKTNEGTEIFLDKADFSSDYAVGLIFIDNLSECLDNVEEKRQGVIRVIVDNKISDYFQNSGGIVKRFENDKYMFFLSGDLLKKCEENKFSILESIKQTDCGDSNSLTLSIGVGTKGKTLKEALDFAKGAVDLALSRGGDQAVIKDNTDAFRFYGGNVSSSGASSRVRARAKAYALSDLMTECSNVLVMGHKNADYDSLGACVGICKIARAFNRPCNIVLGKVTSSSAPLYERLKEDKTYKKAFVSPEDAESLIKEHTLLVIVDCNAAAYFESEDLPKKVNKFILFDHHRKAPNAVSGYVTSYIETRASSTCELICEMLKYINKSFRLSTLEADAMLAGIMLDTKYFTLKTGIQTFEAASYLRKHGADTIRVKQLFKETKKSYFDRVKALNTSEIIRNVLAVAYCEDDCENPVLTTATTADELLKIDDIEASFVLAKSKDFINISMRSMGKINVSLIAEKMGGGGSFEAAACQIYNTSREDAKNSLINILNSIAIKEE
ncbi:MAG: DHH family phosphoesterase, partial [Clostridiales bacterium]|nr:DHH family phosphoesterase [Clostridiales bacterium]